MYILYIYIYTHICSNTANIDYHVLLNEFWDKECVPDELLVNRVVAIFKGGEMYGCGDYHGISLLSVVCKYFRAQL